MELGLKFSLCGFHMIVPGCLPFDRKIRLGCPKHNRKRFISLLQKCHIRYGLNPKKGRVCVASVWSREGAEKLVNGMQHSVWFVPTGMNGLPQNCPSKLTLNFRLEFPKSDLTIYLPSGISEILFQMVSTPNHPDHPSHLKKIWDNQVDWKDCWFPYILNRIMIQVLCDRPGSVSR